jgi:hypothetical protein
MKLRFGTGSAFVMRLHDLVIFFAIGRNFLKPNHAPNLLLRRCGFHIGPLRQRNAVPGQTSRSGEADLLGWHGCVSVCQGARGWQFPVAEHIHPMQEKPIANVILRQADAAIDEILHVIYFPGCLKRRIQIAFKQRHLAAQAGQRASPLNVPRILFLQPISGINTYEPQSR